MYPEFYFTLAYFLVGGLAIWHINGRQPDPHVRKQRWIKFAVYFLVVHAIYLSIIMHQYLITTLCVLICVTGVYEIIKNGRTQPKALAVGLPFYLLVASLFSLFVFRMGMHWQLRVYSVVCCFDGFSQVSGQLFGKRKISSWSPQKSWEGMIGGFLVTVLSMFLLYGEVSMQGFIIVSQLALMSLAAFGGDMLASGYKRACQVKDYGNLLPGHGGVLDRFDSFIGAGALAYLIYVIQDYI